MASSLPSCSFYCRSASVPTVHGFASRPSLSPPGSALGGSGRVSLRRGWHAFEARAKFEKFQGEEVGNDDVEVGVSDSPESREGGAIQEGDDEDDSCLPSDLEGAVWQSSEASASFLSSGGMRAIVELLIPQLQFLDDEGAQAELWELSRVFLDTLIAETGCQRIKAVFPDAGAAALLKYRWQDAAFGFSSLSDRKPVEKEDEIIVMIVPDYQMLEYVERIASDLSDDPMRASVWMQVNWMDCTVIPVTGVYENLLLSHPEGPRPLIMWNPRLISEDVGVGFNVRKLRRYFLSTFTTVYSMRPLPSGAVFRCYPGLWKVFYDDKDRPNRYLLAKEMVSRPDAEELEIIYGDVEESEKGPSFINAAAGIFSSLNRFVKAISK